MSTNDRIDILCIESNRFVASVSFRRLNVPVLAGFEFQSVTSWTRILFFLPSISYCWRYRFDSSQMFFLFLSAFFFQWPAFPPIYFKLTASFPPSGAAACPLDHGRLNFRTKNPTINYRSGHLVKKKIVERKKERREKKSKGERQIQQMTAASAGNKQQQPRRSLEKGPGH